MSKQNHDYRAMCHAAEYALTLVRRGRYSKAKDSMQEADFDGVDPRGRAVGVIQANLHDLNLYRDNLPPAMQQRLVNTCILLLRLYEEADAAFKAKFDGKCA